MHTLNYITAGKTVAETGKALVMVHGRGGSAEDILTLANHLPVEDFALVAPRATNHSWYPYSFLAPPAQNEPWLTSALDTLQLLMDHLRAEGVEAANTWFLGFSQGACLTLEFVTRHATRYGGVIAFTGGLIGDRLYPANYRGDFAGTPVFIGTSDPDPHVPVTRVRETTGILTGMHATVTEKVYPNMGHTIIGDEIAQATRILHPVTPA